MSQFTIKIILGSVIFTENKERALNCCGLSSELFTEKKKNRKEKSSKKKEIIDQNNNIDKKKKMERKSSSGNGLSKISKRFYSMGSQVNTI